MRRLNLIACAAFALVLATGALCLADGSTLAKDGGTEYRIVIPKETDVSTKAVAEDFAGILKEITGAEFAIVTDDTEASAKEIVVGADNARLEKLGLADMTEGFSDGEYEIRTVGKKLVIAGGPNRGTINGMYGFLQDHLGCRWFTPGCMKMPKQSVLKPGEIKDRSKPSFARRSTNTSMHWDAAWTARNRLNQCLTGGGSASISMLMNDDRVKTIGGYPGVHMLSYVPKSLYDPHPEYYAEIDGKRVCHENSNQRAYCVTNPGFVEWFADWLSKGRLRNKGPVQVDISQADTGNNCRCSVCKASYDRVGVPGTYMEFDNAVAERLVKVNPEVEIQTYAYGMTFAAPPVKLHPNIRVIWCPISSCRVHAMDECDGNRDRDLLQVLADWQKQASQIGIWYYHTQQDQLMPHMMMSATAKDFKTYEKMGVDYVFTEVGPSHGMRANEALDGDKLLPAYGNAKRNGYFTVPFGIVHLREYLVTRLLWDTDYDWRAGLREFCDTYYGPAGKEMAEFALMVESVDSYERTLGSIYKSYSGVHQSISVAPKLRAASIEKMSALFEKALPKVANDKTRLRRVEMARASVDLAILCFEPAKSGLRKQAFDRFFPLMEELGLKSITRTPVSFDRKTLAEFKELMKAPEKLVIPGEEPVGANLLSNSSFEIATLGTGIPDSWSGDGSYLPEEYRVEPKGLAIDTTKAYSGKACVKLSKTPAKDSIVSLRQRFDAKPGKRYRASVRYQADLKTGVAVIIFTAFDKNGRWLQHRGGARGVRQTGDKWQELSVDTTVKDDTAQLMIEFLIYNDQSDGVAWIDDFECATVEEKK